MAESPARWDTSYEWKVVTLLGLGFGLVGLDRWIIASLFPAMMGDLHLGYQDLGNLIGALGLVWGIFAILSGWISDKIGHRKIVISAIFGFSLLSGLSGVAVGLGSLLAIRGVMGLMEGSYTPTSFAATAVASEPRRRGFNQGLQQSGFALFGFGLAPIVATQLLAVVPSWRWVFWTVAIPGFIVGTLLFFILREPARTTAAELAARHAEGHNWGALLKTPNIVLCMLGVFCVMSCIFVLGGMLPSYLQIYLKLTPQQTGFVASALGFGGFLGQFGVPGISDMLGRRLVAILAFIGTAVTVYGFTLIGPSPGTLFTVMFLMSFFSLGNVALLTGPIATESAPAGLVSSAIGLVVGTGEIFGGGVAPSIGGFIAEHFGIQNIFYMPLIGVVLGAVVCLGLKETAPRKMQTRSPNLVASR
jgi:MFS family permease